MPGSSVDWSGLGGSSVGSIGASFSVDARRGSGLVIGAGSLRSKPHCGSFP
jgi:hypothetical protein